MSALVKIEDNGLTPAWTDERREFVRKHYCGGAPDAKVEAFLGIAQRRGLSPEEKHIYLVSRAGDWVIQTGIDGYRLIADRTGVYAGSDEPQFLFDPEEDPRTPVLARVTVWKLVQGQRCPFTATAYWDEYYPGDKQGFMWKKMPRTMLAKCAEALALRKAFPAELSGLYVQEEMDQADAQRPSAPPAPVPLRKQLAAPDPQPVEVVDEETGEIVDTPRDFAADRDTAMRRLWASAREKNLSKDQLRAVLKAAYGVESHKELTNDQVDQLGKCYYQLPKSHSTMFGDAMDVLANGMDGQPITAEQLGMLGDVIAETDYPPAVEAVLRLAYTRAQHALEGTR